MKHKLTYILLTLLTLLPIGVKAGKIEGITAIKFMGIPDWNVTQNDAWALNKRNNDANNWEGTFYVSTGTHYIKLYIWSSTLTDYIRSHNGNFPAHTEGVNYGLQNWWSGGDNNTLTTISSSSGYVKLYAQFWGSYGNNDNRLEITQWQVPKLSPTLTGATKVGSGYSTTLTAGCSGGSGSGYNYTYSATAGSVSADGVFTAPTVDTETTVTITVTAQDKHSQLSGLKATKTLTVTVYPMTTIPVYINTSDTDWGSDVQVHYWWDGFGGGDVDATLLNVPHATSPWRVANVPMMQGCSVNIQGKKKDHGGDGDYSENITNITGECAYYIYESDNASYKHTWRNETNGELATTFYMIGSRVDSKWHYSNRLSAAGTFSYFTANNAIDYGLYSGNDIKGYTPQSLTPQKESNVYYTAFNGSGVENPRIYTGDYYIRTISAKGQDNGWKSVSAMTDDEKADARLTYFTSNVNYTDLYNYYWVRYVNGRTHVDAAVANEYNDALTTILGSAGLSNVNTSGNMGDSPGNVRFGYNPTTNTLSRAIIDGSSSGTEYIALGTETSGRLYADEKKTIAITADNPVTFIDKSNWIYEATIYAVPNNVTPATGWVKAKYSTDTQLLFGGTAETPIERELVGVGGTIATDPMKITVVYDYKTNRITAGWTPAESTLEISGNQILAANLMILRTESDEATQVKIADNAQLELTVSKHIFTKLEVTKEHWKDTGGFFWISLPYDCYIKDIYGIEGYGTKWTIQRYRGDKRAELGWFIEYPTFWANMKQTETAKMEANRGYVVYLNLEEGDFESVSKEDATYSSLSLTFPSRETGIMLTSAGQTETTVPEHIRTAERRQADDSNWNVIGVGGLQNMLSSTWTANGISARQASDVVCYEWQWDETEQKGKYQEVVASELTFASTQAYMVQFGGTITWTPAPVSSASNGLQRRCAPEEMQRYAMRIDLAFEDQSARTFIALDPAATKEYDLNLDLGKIINEGITQIYSLSGVRIVDDGAGSQVGEQSRFASNNLPIENQFVQLGVQAPAAGDYTFSIADLPHGVIPMLYDSKTGNTVDLGFDTYTVSLEEGTYDDRFSLRLQVSSVATDSQLITHHAWNVTQVGNELLLSGIEGDANICLYDALGRKLYHSTNPHALIPVYQTGVYLVTVNGQIQRVLVN